MLYIKELLTFAQDATFRKDLSPIYQFYLFRILKWYIDVVGEIEKDEIPALTYGIGECRIMEITQIS